MSVGVEQYAWAAHYLCEMGKAVVDDLTQAMTPTGYTLDRRAAAALDSLRPLLSRDAERHRMRYHAERGNDQAAGSAFLRNTCLILRLID